MLPHQLVRQLPHQLVRQLPPQLDMVGSKQEGAHPLQVSQLTDTYLAQYMYMTTEGKYGYEHNMPAEWEHCSLVLTLLTCM